MSQNSGRVGSPFYGFRYCSIGAIPRANPETLRPIFERFASKTKDNKKYMTAEDFIRRYLGLFTEENYNRESVRLLASAADTTKDGDISFEEFCAFEALLCSPDALYLTAFEIFDRNASDSITCDEFEAVIRHTQPLHDMDFDFNSEFIKKYFGADKKRSIAYHAFTQLLHDFYEEQGIQAFKRYDKAGDGAISSLDFQHIMTTVKKHLLTDFVRNNLLAVSGGGHKVTFAYYAAFNSLLAKMELIKRVYVSQARGNVDLEMTKEEFLQATQSYAQITPYEVEILFHLSELAHPGKKTLSLKDIMLIDPERLKRVSYVERLINFKAVASKEERGVGTAVCYYSYAVNKNGKDCHTDCCELAGFLEWYFNYSYLFFLTALS
uniref:Calcium-binding mitochondrial carrier protein Aralar1 n=1 Tax=Angiostrongylus cantonensis TaxID=6313 RepID=A0A0K0DR66_ANGCA